jgi:ferredoxin-NADP reductase
VKDARVEHRASRLAAKCIRKLIVEVKVPTPSQTRPLYQARVERIVEHCEGTRSLFLRTTTAPLPRYLPGMFISISIPLAHETRLRPYTIVTSPEEGEPFELCFNLVPDGPGAAWMFAREPGDIVDFSGPFGTFTLDRPPDSELVLIAEGTAIAPIRPILRRALERRAEHPIHLLYAGDQPEHLLYRKEFDSMAATHPRLEFEPLIVETAREAIYERLLAEAQRRWVVADQNRSRHFFVAGVGRGVLALRDLLRRAGYERRAVHYEQW